MLSYTNTGSPRAAFSSHLVCVEEERIQYCCYYIELAHQQYVSTVTVHLYIRLENLKVECWS